MTTVITIIIIITLAGCKQTSLVTLHDSKALYFVVCLLIKYGTSIPYQLLLLAFDIETLLGCFVQMQGKRQYLKLKILIVKCKSLIQMKQPHRIMEKSRRYFTHININLRHLFVKNSSAYLPNSS